MVFRNILLVSVESYTLGIDFSQIQLSSVQNSSLIAHSSRAKVWQLIQRKTLFSWSLKVKFASASVIIQTGIWPMGCG